MRKAMSGYRKLGERLRQGQAQGKHALYYSIQVQVLETWTYYALIRRPDGISCIVERADLEVDNV